MRFVENFLHKNENIEKMTHFLNDFFSKLNQIKIIKEMKTSVSIMKSMSKRKLAILIKPPEIRSKRQKKFAYLTFECSLWRKFFFYLFIKRFGFSNGNSHVKSINGVNGLTESKKMKNGWKWKWVTNWTVDMKFCTMIFCMRVKLSKTYNCRLYFCYDQKSHYDKLTTNKTKIVIQYVETKSV